MKKILVYQLFILLSCILFPLRGNGAAIHEHDSLGRDSVNRFMILPGSLRTGQAMTSVSILFTKLPYDWVENAIEVPLFLISNNFKLTKNITLESSFQSVLISNQLRSGPHYYFERGRFTAGGGLDAEFMFGRMQIAGFNNKTWGWCFYPGIRAGFRFKELAVALKGEAMFMNSLKITSGNEEIMHLNNEFSGITFSLYIEQALWKDKRMVLGFINNYQKFFFPAWPSFSTFNRYYYIPQFHVGLIL